MQHATSDSRQWRSWLPLLAFLFIAHPAWAQAPLAIDNVADRSIYNLRVWFRVPSVANFVYHVMLDGLPVPTDVTNWVDRADYHELSVTRTSTLDHSITNRLVRFIVQSERGSPENGLIRWTPYPLVDSTASEFAGARLRIITPAAFPAGLPIPVIAWVNDDQGTERRASGQVTAPGYEDHPIQVKRGVGSGFLPAAGAGEDLSYAAQLHSLQDSKIIAIEPSTPWTPVSGVLTSSTEWPADSRIFINDDLTVPAGTTLTINAGTVVKLNPLVNITNSGRVVIQGTVTRPVVFTATNVVWPEQNAGAWGGFILGGASAELIANGAILAGGGGATSFDFSPGSSHRDEQAVLLIHSGARAALTNCYVINTAGQVGNGYNSDLTLDHCLFQRAITGGEYVGGTITINHSAIIEFPADNGFVDARTADADYDAIYFTEGTHILRDSLIGFSMDDAVDSGSGGSGTVLMTNCWIESTLHEAQAWSGEGRTTWTYDTVSLNCGQGIECGYSTGDNSPICFAERLLSTANAVGARVGDNYDWSYNGFLRLTNSLLLYNNRDIFLKAWNPVGSGLQSSSWVDRLQQVDFRSNLITTAWTVQPGNALWNPAADGWRLTRWMTTPPGAPVGIGLAVRTNQFAMATLFDGVPVRLSSFTTNVVSVNYAFDDDGIVLGSGTLTFTPGETLKRIYPVGWDLFAHGQVRVRLQNPVQAEVTGVREAIYVGNVPVPQVACWVSTNNLPLVRLDEGMLVKLNTPAGQTVTVGYTFTAGGDSLADGTLTFVPGQTVQWINPAGVDPAARDSILLSLGFPTGATLSGNTFVTYGTVPAQVALAVAGTQLDKATFSDGLPLRLNRASLEMVSVDFQCEGSTGVLTNGTVVFGPGQVFETLWLPTVNPDQSDLLWVSLTAAHHAELVPPTNALFLPLTPVVSPILVANQSGWRYLDTGGNPGMAWRLINYDDSGWSNGVAQLGFSDQDEATPIRQVGTNGQDTITFYFRHGFVVQNPGALTDLVLRLLRDDGGVVYLNGSEVYRSPTLPPSPTAITYQTLANYLSISDAPPDNVVDEANLPPSLLVAGTNLVAVEIHQHRTDSSDVSFDCSLTSQPTPPPAPRPLFWGRFGGRQVLVWDDPAFALEQAGILSGPWTRVSGAISPWAVNLGAGDVFYRLRR